MQYLLLLLVAPAVLGDGVTRTNIGDKLAIDPLEPIPLPDFSPPDIFDPENPICGFNGFPDCEDINPCGEPCEENEICRFKDKVLQCVPTGCTGMLDICVVIDQSGSIGSTNFGTLINFVKDIIDNSDVGEDAIKFAVTQFGQTSQVAWDLDDPEATDADAAKDALMAIQSSYGSFPVGARTCIHCGLCECNDNVFGNDGDRSDADNVVIVFTDGDNNIPNFGPAADDLVIDKADELKGAPHNARVVTVAIGNNLDQSVLDATASDADSSLSSDGFNDLTNILDDLLAAACS